VPLWIATGSDSGDNPPTAARLPWVPIVYDPNLQGQFVSCSSCHDPQRGFADPQERSIGVGGTRGLRHAPSLLNAAYLPLLFGMGARRV
jgi:cytochrome c peroxidase